MYSTAVRGNAAAALRSGRQAGLYSDAISWHQNVGRQFPDQQAQQRHIDAVLSQAGNIASMGGGVGGGGSGGSSSGGGGLGGMLPMMKGMLPFLGVGLTAGFAGKKIGDATDEAIGMSSLRRAVDGTNLSFEDFRKQIRASTDGMALNTAETIKAAHAYAEASGAIGAGSVSAGAQFGARLARERGLDVSTGVGAMGRATWLGLGKNEDASFKKLAEIMAGSGLGKKQGEAAEALLRFVDRSNMHQVVGADVGFRDKYLALVTSGNTGLRNNAESILGGYDAAVRQGGHAGDAGRNLMYNALSEHGINDPIQMMRMQQRGFFGNLGEDGKGPMIGEVIAKFIKKQGGNQDLQGAKLAGFFGNDIDVAKKAFGVMEKFKFDQPKMKKALEALAAEQESSDPGYKAAQAKANLEKELTDALDGLVTPITTLTTGISELVKGVNIIASWLPKPDAMQTDMKSAADAMRSDPGMIGDMARKYARNTATPWKGQITEMGKNVGDQGWDMQVDRYAVQYGVQYKTNPSSNSKVHNMDVTAGHERNIAQFALAVDQFSKASGKVINVRVQYDKNGNAIVPKPSHNPSK
jgi:hypothetical protein